MSDDLALSRKLILLGSLFVVFCSGMLIFLSGYGVRHESGTGYSYASAIVAWSLLTTAASMLMSMINSLYYGRPKIDSHILGQSIALFVMCLPICVCQYFLFLDGQLSAMGKTLEWKIVDAAVGIGLYMILLFIFYGILWRVLVMSVDTKDLKPVNS